MLGTPGAQKTPGRVWRKAARMGVFDGLGQMRLSEDDWPGAVAYAYHPRSEG